MEIIKQSTAVTKKMGPFVDDSDGKTAETGLTISQADIRLSKNGGAFAQTNNAAGATHDEKGYYGVPLDTTDTGTLGSLRVAISESGALPVWADFMVVTANVYDTLFSTDILQSDLTQIGGVAQSATDLKDFADAGYDPGTNKITGCKASDDMRGTDNAALAASYTAARAGYIDNINNANLATIADISTLTATEIAYLNAAISSRSSHDAAAVWAVATRALTDKAGFSLSAAGITAILQENISAYSGAGYVGTYIKTLYDDLLDGGRLDLLIDAIKAQTDDLPSGPAKGVELANFEFLMVLSSDHITPATGKTLIEQISKDGGAFVACTNDAAEIGSGVYKITITSTEMNADVIVLKFTEANCDQRTITILTST